MAAASSPSMGLPEPGAKRSAHDRRRVLLCQEVLDDRVEIDDPGVGGVVAAVSYQHLEGFELDAGLDLDHAR